MQDLLKKLPLSEREILYVVQNDQDKVMCYFEGLTFDSIRKDHSHCRLVTLEEIKNSFPECGGVVAGNLLIWSDFSQKYLSSGDFAESRRQRCNDFLSFCKDYLGAVSGNVHFEEKNKSSADHDVSVKIGGGGSSSAPGGNAKNASQEADNNTSTNTSQEPISGSGSFKFDFSKNRSEKREEKYLASFTTKSPIPFDPAAAKDHYERLNLRRFEEFQTAYEFRIKSPGTVTHEFNWDLVKEVDNKLRVAFDFQMKIKECFDLNAQGDYKTNTHDFQQSIFEVHLEYK